jgi:4-amino-4-deoxy-L-arabinose transferase-like glycosyltransferase
LPWLGPLLVGLARSWRMRRDAAAEPALYAGAGLVAGLLLFSIGQGKVASYILPLAPLAALVLTWELGREVLEPRVRTLGPTLLSATLAAAAALLGLAGVTRLAGAERSVALLGAVCFAAAALVAVAAIGLRRPRWVWAAAATSTATFLMICVLVLYPALGRERSAAALIDSVPDLAASASIATVDVRVPSLSFYLDRPVPVLEMGDLEDRLGRSEQPLFVMADVDLPFVPASAAARLEEAGRHGKYVVFRERTPARPDPEDRQASD